MAWVSPTGHSDPDGEWTDEANAYDGDVGTYATSAVGVHSLELSRAALFCDKLRLYFPGVGTARFTLDVYYSSAWNNLADSGDPATAGEWHEYAIGSVESVTAARIQFEFGTGLFTLAELEFHDMGTWKKVAFTDDAPSAHKDSHDPNDGSDPLDTAAAGEIVGVAAAAVGTAHSFARSDHTHQIQHSIADNHVVTIDDADAASGQICKFTANGIEGVTAVIATDTLWDAKGDLAAGTGANTASRLAVGANDTVLTAASGEATGLKWAAVPAVGFTSSAKAYRSTTNQTIPSSVATKVQYNAEDFDTSNEFTIATITGTADATEANKLHDADGGFSAANVGDGVWNTTDNTFTTVSAYVDSGELTLAANIMANGEAYILYKSRFVVTTAGIYLVTASVMWDATTVEANKRYAIYIYVNGAEVTGQHYTASYATYISTPATNIFSLSASDYIEAYVWNGGTAAAAIMPLSRRTWLAVQRLA